MRGRLCHGICEVGSVFGRIRFVLWRERDKGDERAAVQFVAFQRHGSEAGAGRLAGYKHVNTGIVRMGGDYCCYDCPHKKLISLCDYLTLRLILL